MTKKWTTAALAGILALGAATAQAGQHGTGGDDARAERRAEMFGQIDTDGNGALSLEEMRAHAGARFGQADTDGDGLLSTQELNAAASARIADRTARMIERMDEDGDGLLSVEEMRGRHDPARMFERADDDGDGQVSAEEFAQMGPNRGGGHGEGRHHKRRHGDEDRGGRENQ